jgi:uncharacterized protein YsxB (DUF464 family)
VIRAEAEGLSLRLRGQAGSGEPGRDLICAGVSALVLALREELLHLEDKGAIRFRTLRLEPGDAEIRCDPVPGQEETVKVAFDTVLRGLRLMERLFGDHVQVTVPDAGKKE